MEKLKFKKDCEPMSICDDFFYYLDGGGWLKPEDYLEEEDAKRVEEAVKLIAQFEREGIDLGFFEEC